MGRKKKYTALGLEKAISRWFDSITREVTMTELRPTGERDEKGHELFETVPVLNRLGEPVVREVFLVPPTVGGLCAYLGISDQTWENYCDEKKHPEFVGTTTRARSRMREWNMQQLLTREGKDVRGIIFNLQNNYGMKERREMSLDEKTAEALTPEPEMTLAEKLRLLQELQKETVSAL